MADDKFKTNPRQIIKNFLRPKVRRLVERMPQSIRNPLYSDALKKYDRRAGNYVKFYQTIFQSDELAEVVLNGEVKRGRIADAFHSHLDWLANQFRSLGLTHASLLEVGAGELTTLAPVAKRLNEPTLSAHACELSWSRCHAGRDFARDLNVPIASITSANVTQLPFATDSIDIVFTHYALEELGGYEREAIQELMRVARRAVVIIEASYELGSAKQRRKLRNRGWNVGILKAIASLGLKLGRHELVPYCTDAGHHGSFILLEKQSSSAKSESLHACPACKGPVEKGADAFFCQECSLAYPILDGIPVFLPRSAIIASRYHPKRVV